jgi:thioredoxin 1
MAIRRISRDQFGLFLRKSAYAVVLFDAPWDVGPGSLIRPRFEEAARAFDGRVRFGEVDCDELADVAKAIGLSNVPAVWYYEGGRLIAALVGVQQGVVARPRAMLGGGPIGRNDGREGGELIRISS